MTDEYDSWDGELLSSGKGYKRRKRQEKEAEQQNPEEEQELRQRNSPESHFD